MGIRYPNIPGSTSSGGRWALKKHTHWPTEFARIGASDGTVDTDLVDSDGHTWTWADASATTLELQASGIVSVLANVSTGGISIITRDVIPNLAKDDRLFAVWRIEDALFGATESSIACTHLRNGITNPQTATIGWLDTGAIINLWAKVVSPNPGDTTEYTLASASQPDKYFGLSAAGIRWQYYTLGGTVPPEQPDDMDLLSIPPDFSGALGGNLTGNIPAGPNVSDVDVTTDRFICQHDSIVGATSKLMVFKEFWLYRFE